MKKQKSTAVYIAALQRKLDQIFSNFHVVEFPYLIYVEFNWCSLSYDDIVKLSRILGTRYFSVSVDPVSSCLRIFIRKEDVGLPFVDDLPF